GDTAAYQGFVRHFAGDIMLNYAAQIWSSDLVFPLLHELACKKVFVPCGYSALHDPRFRAYFARMPEVLQAYDEVVYLSETYQDRRFAQHSGAGDGTVIGNGASADEFGVPASGFREAFGVTTKRMFICVANLMDDKGQREVYDAFQAARVTDATLVFIGTEVTRYASGAMRTRPGLAYGLRRKLNVARWEFLESRSDRHRLELHSRPGTAVVILAGVPRELVLAAYAEADLFLFASRVECAPLVIYETMAAGTPFITTCVGNVAELPGGVVVDGPAQMAAEIDRLCDDERTRMELSRVGRDAWRKDHTWGSIVDRYERLYREVLGG
ncbi:MAG: glycosyltransferase family 4 protein, partial [Actinomycetia bacterium]|nr:glycosyltransferase family 4 protein [Actinomycetes bacterium]